MNFVLNLLRDKQSRNKLINKLIVVYRITVHNNWKETTRPLIALHPNKEVPSLETFKECSRRFSDPT